jgi:hypothetical protein
MPAFVAIVSTATTAYLGAPIWTILIGTAALMLMSAVGHRHFAASFAKPYARSALTWAAWRSAGHAMLASGGAYLLGYVTRLSF